jgi:Ulp1 family protease
VINFYFSLLDERNKRHQSEKKVGVKRMHFFNSFFYTKLSENNSYNYKNVSRYVSHRIAAYHLKSSTYIHHVYDMMV